MYRGYCISGLRGFDHWRIEAATTETLNETLDPKPTLEATQGQMGGFSSQPPFNLHHTRVASVRD